MAFNRVAIILMEEEVVGEEEKVLEVLVTEEAVSLVRVLETEGEMETVVMALVRVGPEAWVVEV